MERGGGEIERRVECSSVFFSLRCRRRPKKASINSHAHAHALLSFRACSTFSSANPHPHHHDRYKMPRLQARVSLF
jgi:hypothetical protein